MPRTSITETEIRETLLKTARKAFLQNGIHDTEMKNIAESSGLSRSTVYRHAIDKSQLAFRVVEREIDAMVGDSISFAAQPGSNGHDRLVAFMNRMLDVFEERRNDLHLIAEFDTIYKGDYPDIPEARDYVVCMQRYHSICLLLVLDGLADHSLTNIPNANVFTAMVMNTIFGLALRLYPREAHYIEEHDSGARPMIDEAIRVILSAVTPAPDGK